MKFALAALIGLSVIAAGCGSSSTTSSDTAKPISAPSGAKMPGAPAGAPGGPGAPKSTTPQPPGK